MRPATGARQGVLDLCFPFIVGLRSPCPVVCDARTLLPSGRPL